MKVVLTVVDGPHAGQTFAFEQHDNFIVGRASYAHFRLPKKDQHFSRVHFMIEVNPPECRLMDMGSRNGTFVNGRRVKHPVDVQHGDSIKGGNTVIRVAIDAARNEAAEVSTGGQAAGGTPQDSECTGRQPEAASFESVAPPASFAFGPTDVRKGAEAAADAGKLENRRPASSAASSSGVDEYVRGSRSVSLRGRDAPGTSPHGPAAAAPTDSADLRDILPSDFEQRIAARQQMIPGYLLIDEIGRGGMGIVYLALREADQTVVAVKTIKPERVADPADLERFLREAAILRELAHPHIVAFRDMGEADGELFFAMDYVPGVDVAKLLRDEGKPLEMARALRLMCQLLDALEFAHAKGYVHRDIKPANLLVTRRDGREMVKLADFGLARTYQSSRLSGLTMMGDVGGTIPFMSPEQITNYREAKPPADQFAAAATFYYLLTSQFIHDFPDDVSQQLLMILQQDAVPIRQRRPKVSEELAAVIHRALDRNPVRRFPDVAALRQGLARFAQPRDRVKA